MSMPPSIVIIWQKMVAVGKATRLIDDDNKLLYTLPTLYMYNVYVD